MLETLAQMEVGALARSGLDEETYLLIRLAALVATDAAPVSYRAHLGGRLALHDEALIESVLAMRLKWAPPDAARRLSPKTHALVRLAALLALGAAPVSYQWSVEAALDADATTEEILGTMIAVAPISGIARVVQATPDIALQLGYDLDAAFEELD